MPAFLCVLTFWFIVVWFLILIIFISILTFFGARVLQIFTRFVCVFFFFGFHVNCEFCCWLPSGPHVLLLLLLLLLATCLPKEFEIFLVKRAQRNENERMRASKSLRFIGKNMQIVG